MSPIVLLSLIVFLPALGALAVALFVPKNMPDAAKLLSLAVTVVVLVLCALPILPGFSQADFKAAVADMQQTFNVEWIPSFNIYYFMGTDGISYPLLLLTAFVSALAMWASWGIEKHVKAYCILFLLLETGMLGVFLALDFFLFYVFWEVMLLPMYFLIGIWGGPRREYAAIKFFLYTLLGSVLMLVAILMLYFTSDLRALHGDSGAKPIAWSELHLHENTLRAVQARGSLPFASNGEGKPTELVIRSLVPGVLGWNPENNECGDVVVQFRAAEGVTAGGEKVSWNKETAVLTVEIQAGATRASDVAKAINEDAVARQLFAATVENGPGGPETAVQPSAKAMTISVPAGGPVHTFNLVALAKLGQRTNLFNNPRTNLLGYSVQMWAFVLLFIGFVIKVPVVPVHTWLPDAHVEAPTPISMILAGVLLKMGGYGLIRICYPICPEAAFDLAWLVCGFGVLSMVYGAFAALAQKDFKRLVAYSSVSHMGYVVLGLGVWSSTAGNFYLTDSWAMGMNGAMFQMIAHGISSPGMFFLVGVVYDRVHHRNLDEFGGLMHKMPVYGGLTMGIFFAGLGLPGLCGFIGEVFVTLSVWKYSHVLAVISAAVVIITAGYILWTLQRVLLGPEYKGPHPEALTPMTPREVLIGAPLLAFAILFGVYPQAVFNYMSPSVNQVVKDLTDWDRRNERSAKLLKSREARTSEAAVAEAGAE